MSSEQTSGGGFVGVTCLRCENGAEYVPCVGPGPGWLYTDIGAAAGWLCPGCVRIEMDELRQRVAELEETIESHAAQCDAGEQVREAAWWVVMNWDTQSTQHGSMPALRRALGLPGERPTPEEAQRRLIAHINRETCS